MRQFWENIIIAAFTVLLTATFSLVAFTYLKIDQIDKRLVVIETMVKMHHPIGASNAKIWEEEPVKLTDIRIGIARSLTGSDKTF